MSEERFDRIEHELSDFRARFDSIDARFVEVDARFAEVDARFDRVDVRFAEVDARFDRVDARFTEVDARFDRVETRLDGLDNRMDELGRHMRVLYEDMMANFAAASERNAVSRDEFHATIAERDERFGRRLDPLEMASARTALTSTS